MKATAFLLTLAVAASTSFAQTPPDSEKAQAAVIANDRAYEAAYAKADAKALADFFAEDAEYTTESGNTLSGRAAIEESIRTHFLSAKGEKLAIDATSVQVLAPEVVLEKGSTKVTSKTGEVDESLYTAIHLKKDGKWKIGHIVETPMPDVTPHDRLSELQWLIGAWEEADKEADLSVRSSFIWARGGNFITRNITVKRGGQTTIEGWQIIGWDPTAGGIRSWTFDGEGGFAEGRWTNDGNRWLVRETGTAPDGSKTTSDSTLSKVSADRLKWESYNRTLNGDPQPNIGPVEIRRVKGE